MLEWPLPTALVCWITLLSEPLHQRLAWRLLPLLRGVLFAHGRRTVAPWLRAAGLGDDFRHYYYFRGSRGRKTEYLASRWLRLAVTVIVPGERLLFGLDDTPTQRAGPKIEGAGIPHHPRPGPAGAKFLSGHFGVTLAGIVRHPRWGAIGLPLRAGLYVRQKQSALLQRCYGLTFQTKLELAARLVAWVADWLRYLGQTLWVVADGAYAQRPFRKAARQAQVVVVSRLRKDAKLWSVPRPPRSGQPKKRGPKPTYGQERIILAKRAGHRRGGQTEELLLYRERVTKTFQTFLATYRPAGGLIRWCWCARTTAGWRSSAPTRKRRWRRSWKQSRTGQRWSRTSTM